MDKKVQNTILTLYTETSRQQSGRWRIIRSRKEKNNTDCARECQITRGSRGEVHSKDQEESTQKTSQKGQSRASSEMLLVTRKEEGQKKAVDRTVCERAFH